MRVRSRHLQLEGSNREIGGRLAHVARTRHALHPEMLHEACAHLAERRARWRDVEYGDSVLHRGIEYSRRRLPRGDRSADLPVASLGAGARRSDFVKRVLALSMRPGLVWDQRDGPNG